MSLRGSNPAACTKVNFNRTPAAVRSTAFVDAATNHLLHPATPPPSTPTAQAATVDAAPGPCPLSSARVVSPLPAMRTTSADPVGAGVPQPSPPPFGHARGRAPVQHGLHPRPSRLQPPPRASPPHEKHKPLGLHGPTQLQPAKRRLPRLHCAKPHLLHRRQAQRERRHPTLALRAPAHLGEDRRGHER